MPLPMTKEQEQEFFEFTRLERYFDALNKRVGRRRVKNKIPENFTVFELGTDGSYISNTSVLLAVDQSTSGKFAFVKREIGFQTSADLTMFLITYVPSEPLRIR